MCFGNELCDDGADDYNLDDELDKITASGRGMGKCPYDCGETIDTVRQSHEIGGGVFVCPTCGNRSSIDEKTKQLAPVESFAATCAVTSDTTHKT
jgi:hypothetical protein